MSMQVTILLDSGAFFEELAHNRSYPKLEVGYFNSGPDVPELSVLTNGDELNINSEKLGRGTIEIHHLNSSGQEAGNAGVTHQLAGSILRKKDLYPDNPPDFDRKKFDCVLEFYSGRFCCSMVKERRFVEVECSTKAKTGKDKKTAKQISHNVAVHFDLADGDRLEIKRGGNILFSTNSAPAGTKRVDIDIVADNTTAERLYREALILKGNTCWLPNQGDPPTLGSP